VNREIKSRYKRDVEREIQRKRGNEKMRPRERGKRGIRKDCVSITVAAYTLSLLFALHIEKEPGQRRGFIHFPQSFQQPHKMQVRTLLTARMGQKLEAYGFAGADAVAFAIGTAL
jgi:hypothetical protein